MGGGVFKNNLLIFLFSFSYTAIYGPCYELDYMPAHSAQILKGLGHEIQRRQLVVREIHEIWSRDAGRISARLMGGLSNCSPRPLVLACA